MPSLEMEIELSATPERVWEVLTDFHGYADWHPFQTIEGEAERFAPLRIASRLSADSPEPETARALIWKFDACRRLHILSGKPLIYSSLRYFDLQPTDAGTRLRHGVRISGLLARWRFSHGHQIDRLKPYYESFGDALRRRVSGAKPSRRGQSNRHQRRAKGARSKHDRS